jgi:hypothetical protein
VIERLLARRCFCGCQKDLTVEIRDKNSSSLLEALDDLVGRHGKEALVLRFDAG